MEYFDAYEEVYSAIERFADEHGKPPATVYVSPVLYRWLMEMKKESVALNMEEASDGNSLQTRFGAIPLALDEMLSPYEILTE
ncbi:MAG: hypothetical protein JNL32_03945 [Candidatus Kapabacteria bacterium]|nr:hypothetical protein [Candidatus Kapabacteria bacterium]